ncbi:hypothetical protein KIN20_001964 [Parelaphostrongylus tenuis]|uniref:BTB domain-containing protein n=1 Tax=Parelaphostrongylus tenuis TaxID=148309 RepID=A0AAD5LUI4_PARTN|nr:hypothetical protein KIN20_001964 [Parelaphostrongylus tenuis]
MAHKLVLSSASTQFRNLLANRQSEESMAKIDIDLREIPNSINAFKAMLNGLYTGELNYTLADHAEVRVNHELHQVENGSVILLTVVTLQILAVARHCQVPTIESKLLAANQDSNPLTALLSQPEFSIIALSPPCERPFSPRCLAVQKDINIRRRATTDR